VSINRKILSMIATLCCCFAILFFRLPESFLDPEIVLVDGATFWLDAKVIGPSTLFFSQSGYLALFPHIVALLAAKLTIIEKIAFTYSAHLVTLILLIYLLSNRNPLRFKPLLALIIVICPQQAHWIHGSALNAIWLLGLLLLLFTILKPPASIAAQIFDMCLILLSALSSPLILWMMAFFILRYRQKQDRYSKALCLTASLCWLIQFVVFISSYDTRAEGEIILDYAVWIQVLVKLFSGQLLPNVVNTGATLGVGIALVLLYFYLSYILAVTKKYQLLYLLLAGFLTSLAPVFSYLASPRELYWHADRYKYIAAVTLLWVLVQQISKKNALGLLSISLLAISFYNSLFPLRTFEPKMQRSACADVSADLAPLQCANGLEYRWYFSQ